MAPIQIYRKVKAPDVPVAVESVELDADTLYLREGEQDILEALVLPEDAKNKDVEWGSMDNTIAFITDGLVLAVKKGETKVWVRTLDGGFTDTCFVKVYASLDQPDVTWNRLQSLDSLKDGVRVFFASVREGEDYVMGMYDYDVAKANIQGAAATFSENRHTVTASEAFAYTVTREGEKILFRDLDGSYLCDYNKKNLSAQDNLDNKARWTGTMNEDFEFIFTNTYNTGYVIYNNHNSDMFCCYDAFDQSNMARIAIFSENAPEWVEPEKHPSVIILSDKDTITTSLPFGEVEYDPTWGTEVDPYQSLKTLTFVTNDVEDSIRLSLHKGEAFSLLTNVIKPTGGTASVVFSTKNVGSYTDTLYVTCDTISYTILLTAEAVQPTALDEVNVPFQMRKMMINGKLYIERNGIKYDILGNQ